MLLQAVASFRVSSRGRWLSSLSDSIFPLLSFVFSLPCPLLARTGQIECRYPEKTGRPDSFPLVTRTDLDQRLVMWSGTTSPKSYFSHGVHTLHFSPGAILPKLLSLSSNWDAANISVEACPFSPLPGELLQVLRPRAYSYDVCTILEILCVIYLIYFLGPGTWRMFVWIK